MFKKIYCGKIYDTATATKIGEFITDCHEETSPLFCRQTLFLTPKGEPFMVVEGGKEAAYERAGNRIPVHGSPELFPISLADARMWATMYCVEALERLNEVETPVSNHGLKLLTDYRCGNAEDAVGYVHHIVYKVVNGEDYVIASNRPDYSLFPQSQTVAITGANSMDGHAEDLYIHRMSTSVAMRWAEENLPADAYIKCFGPVEEV